MRPNEMHAGLAKDYADLLYKEYIQMEKTVTYNGCSSRTISLIRKAQSISADIIESMKEHQEPIQLSLF